MNTAAFATPVVNVFQRAVHLIDAGFSHGEGGNFFREQDGKLMTTDAPFDRVAIMTKSTPTTRMSLSMADLVWA